MSNTTESSLSAYAERLEELAATRENYGGPSEWYAEAHAAVDGQFGESVRAALLRSEGQYEGAFFSGEDLSEALVRPYLPITDTHLRLLDPACGTGDLLAAVAWHLPLSPTLKGTLELWGQMISGSDLYAEFIRLTKARLALIATLRHTSDELLTQGEIDASFPHLQQGDGLKRLASSGAPALILMNPPFGRAVADSDYAQGTGSVSQAAVFLDACLRAAQKGARIAAILPDVIRSGSNYRKLRASVEERAQVNSIEIVGRFSKSVDVDVFILRAVAGSDGQDKANWWPKAGDSVHSVADFFEVCVGPVVPHRDEEEGPERPFLYARAVPKGGRFNSDDAPLRRYRSRSFTPPFAVVRRTSSPSDRTRIICTIVDGSQDVTIENHLLVVKPTSTHSLEEFQKVLSSTLTATWLDQRLRCRHLTVAAVAGIPWVLT